jgi:hypothetical protein
MVSPSEGWAVGGGGAIWHYDGTTWRAVASPTHTDLLAVAMVSASEGWAGGGACSGGVGPGGSPGAPLECSSVLLHYTEGTWRMYESS